MSEQAPNTMVTAIIVIIVIFVMGIMVLTLFPDTVKPITDIFAEVFHAQAAEKADAETAAVETSTSLLSNIAACEPGGKYNPTGSDKCACALVGSNGRIPTESRITIENSLGSAGAKITVSDKNQKILSEEIKSYNLGLFAISVKGDKRELVCMNPDNFYISGVDSSNQNTLNKWHAVWLGDIIQGTRTLNFYVDTLSTKYESLRSAPDLYRVSSTQYCLLTDLVEQDITTNYEYSTDIKEIGPEKTVFSTTTNFNDVIQFFTDKDIYCKRDQQIRNAKKDVTVNCCTTDSGITVGLYSDCPSQYQVSSEAYCPDINDKLTSKYSCSEQQKGTLPIIYYYSCSLSSDDEKTINAVALEFGPASTSYTADDLAVYKQRAEQTLHK